MFLTPQKPVNLIMFFKWKIWSSEIQPLAQDHNSWKGKAHLETQISLTSKLLRLCLIGGLTGNLESFHHLGDSRSFSRDAKSTARSFTFPAGPLCLASPFCLQVSLGPAHLRTQSAGIPWDHFPLLCQQVSEWSYPADCGEVVRAVGCCAEPIQQQGQDEASFYLSTTGIGRGSPWTALGSKVAGVYNFSGDPYS